MAELPEERVEEEAVKKERSVVRVDPEDYDLVDKNYTAVKVICLGDSAVGKSKLDFLFQLEPVSLLVLPCYYFFDV